MAGVCRNRIKGDIQTNYHIFINSVEDITKIVRIAKLKPEHVRIVCSLNGDSPRKIMAKLGKDYQIEKVSDPVKLINLYTSTAFEGQDIYDKNGRTFVVSNADKDHTLVDISTEFIQICGRIRNSDYNSEIVYFYSTKPYDKDITLNEYIEVSEKSYAKAVRHAKKFNAQPLEDRQAFPYINRPYARIEDNKIIVDRNLLNWDIINYKVCNGLYACNINLQEEMERNGIEITDNANFATPDRLSDKLLSWEKVSFKERFIFYCELREAQPMFILTPDYRIELIEKIQPLIKNAYEGLGKEKVEQMNYHQSNIRRELVKRSGNSMAVKIVKLINQTFDQQVAIPAAQVKKKLQEIYADLGISRKAKTTDLKDWYEIKQVNKTINGKSTACVIIIRDKFIGLNESKKNINQ